MNRLNAADVRSWTVQTNWLRLGYPAPNVGDPDPLEQEVSLANDYVEQTTGRPLDATLPAQFVNMASKAVALRTVQQVVNDDEDSQEALMEAQILSGFTAQGYSEQYRDPGAEQQGQNKAYMVNAHPELNRLLWMLMTPERFGWWRAFLEGGGIPSWGVIEMDWSGANRWGAYPDGPGAGGLPGDLPGVGGGLPGGGGEGWFGGVGWPTGSFTGVLAPDGG